MNFQQLVTVAPWTLILQICNLLLQMWLFKKFLLKPVQNILAKRQELANAELDAAAAAREDAESAKEEYEKHLTGAREEAAALVRSAAQTAQTRKEQTHEDVFCQRGSCLGIFPQHRNRFHHEFAFGNDFFPRFKLDLSNRFLIIIV